MARQPRPPKGYDPLAMARELNAAIDGKPVRTSPAPVARTSPAPQDYRRSLYEGLFQ